VIWRIIDITINKAIKNKRTQISSSTTIVMRHLNIKSEVPSIKLRLLKGEKQSSIECHDYIDQINCPLLTIKYSKIVKNLHHQNN
jgi:hypothetical protein